MDTSTHVRFVALKEWQSKKQTAQKTRDFILRSFTPSFISGSDNARVKRCVIARPIGLDRWARFHPPSKKVGFLARSLINGAPPGHATTVPIL
ncbi:hypothetical protein B4113_0596 [Geobacillus sp. B4113_201601]|nr:hypothetical protein B4113_0596 [Geobacillus sp. B4113_201601]